MHLGPELENKIGRKRQFRVSVRLIVKCQSHRERGARPICGFINARRLAFQALTTQERKRKIAQGYCDDLLLKQPAVMDLNMRAASAGVLLLRHLLQPFCLSRSPSPSRRIS